MSESPRTTSRGSRPPLIADGRLTPRALRILAFMPPLALAALLVGGGIGWAGGTWWTAQHAEPVATAADDAAQTDEREREGSEAPVAAAAPSDHDPRPVADRDDGNNDRVEATKEPTQQATEAPTDTPTEAPAQDGAEEDEAEDEPTEGPDGEPSPAPEEPADDGTDGTTDDGAGSTAETDGDATAENPADAETPDGDTTADS